MVFGHLRNRSPIVSQTYVKIKYLTYTRASRKASPVPEKLQAGDCYKVRSTFIPCQYVE